ncbi:MAG: A/G-specific adenine glycosylase [Bacteroidota bacterium]
MNYTEQILKWYDKERRNLPWRNADDPYLIWLSEIILQQTRVDQGMEYYHRFAKKYPELKDFASAPEKDILKLWQGLGYYSRARNMLNAANQLMNDFNGEFPAEYDLLIKLKGVGDYTAAAIASIAFGQVVPVVDGNVKRVISRIFGLNSSATDLYKEVKEKMSELIDKNRPGDFNQAVMEFGALCCTPANPACEKCMFNAECFAHIHNKVAELPAKPIKKKPEVKYFSYLVIRVDGVEKGVVFKKRTEKGIWKNLYEFPLIETGVQIDQSGLMENTLYRKWFGENEKIIKSSKVYKHQLTHRTIYASFHFVRPGAAPDYTPEPSWEILNHNSLVSYPVPRLIERFIKEYQSDIDIILTPEYLKIHSSEIFSLKKSVTFSRKRY